MFCKNCGTQMNDDAVFCKKCGTALSDDNSTNHTNNHIAPIIIPETESSGRSWGVAKIAKTILLVLVICVGIYFKFFNILNNQAVDTNNKGLTAYESGNSDQAISQFKQASDDALSNETKISTLKNLAYVYATEGKNDLALKTFQEAFALTTKDTFDYYLISGEIALLKKDPKSAQAAYLKAYDMKPNEFQSNNALALFYLDLDEVAPQYVDYKKALTYAQKAYDLSKMEIAKQNLAIAYYFNKKYNESILLLASSDFTKQPYSAFWLGMDYLAKEDHVNAKTYFRKAIANGATAPKEIANYLNSN